MLFGSGSISSSISLRGWLFLYDIRFESDSNKTSTIIVEGDKTRIFQVISNLLNDAIKFTENGEVVVVLNERDGQAIVSVRDTGSGIASEIYPKFFAKFASKSEKGTGLGLFLAKNIVESHGGKIWAINNSDGNGATFAFSMPILTHDDDTIGTRTNEKNYNSTNIIICIYITIVIIIL